MTYQDILARKDKMYELARIITHAEREELDRLRADLQRDCGEIGHIVGKDTNLMGYNVVHRLICGWSEK